MEDLLPYYERELVALRRYSREFAERYPAVAGRLQISADGCADPHAEHLIQAVALLAARVSKRLDDDYPQFTEALLEALFPHYLRPFPSCAIVQAQAAGQLVPAAPVARGAALEAAPVQGVRCKFKSAYALSMLPVRISAARFDAVGAHRGGPALEIVIESQPSGPALAQLPAKPLRVYLDGDASFCAALRDAMFISATGAALQADEDPPLPLAEVPIAPVGFAEDEALLPFCARSHRAHRLLLEYFAFPEKFNFVDIDLGPMRSKLPAGCRRCTLRLELQGAGPETPAARILRGLSADNLRLDCTPVVNLFQRHGEPVTLTEHATDYAVLAHPTHPHAHEVYSVDAVSMVRQGEGRAAAVEFRPFYALRHGEQAQGHYWVLRHDEALAAISPGHEKRLSLVDIDAASLAPGKAILSLELTCTNRDLPRHLPYAQQHGDLTGPDLTGELALRFVRRPTAQRRAPPAASWHWRLISQLALNQQALTQGGLPALRELLSLYDPARAPVSQRQIAGVAGLEQRPAVHWMRQRPGASLVHGTEVRLTLDEAAFAGGSLHLFAQVIDRFLGLYTQVNSFTELVIVSAQTSKEVLRCRPRSGYANLA